MWNAHLAVFSLYPLKALPVYPATPPDFHLLKITSFKVIPFGGFTRSQRNEF
jgi:hypothetical protein